MKFHILSLVLVSAVATTVARAEEPEVPYYDPFAHIDTAIGEKVWPKEKENALEIKEMTKHFIQRRYDEGRRPAMRDAHAKPHGCVESSFTVRNDIPEDLRHGLFSTAGAKYRATIRYSNGNAEIRTDGKRDGRGMAVKVLGVPGDKLIKDFPEQTTQDFLMINHPAFFIDDPSHYVKTIKVFHSEKFNSDTAGIAALIAGGLKGKERLVALDHQTKVQQLFKEPYWSETPYRLGVTANGNSVQAVKFSAFPVDCNNMDYPRDHAAQQAMIQKFEKENHKNIPQELLAQRDYLRDGMVKHLSESDACFVFGIQRSVDATKTPVEKTTTSWDEVAAFVPVANIVITKGQDFSTEEALNRCENLSYSPWHTLPEHKPLGAVNRARLIVYSTISKHRRDLNKVPYEEREKP